jgi:raffinose/stachyose/melibiose transport system substrate-binding protein
MPSGKAGMGFVIPFRSNPESENILVNQANEYVENGYYPVSWVFPTMPSDRWRSGVGSALTAYAADQTDDNWDKVVKAFVDDWAREAKR